MIKTLFLVFSLTVALAAACGNACAASAEDTAIPDAALQPLAAWVAQATRVNIAVLPIAVASDGKLKRALHVQNVQQAGAAAAYLPGRIVIRSDLWDPASLKSQSYLVHELVHHAQLISGKAYPCRAAKEEEAYRLQNLWLREHDLPPIVSENWIKKMSSCGAATRADDE